MKKILYNKDALKKEDITEEVIRVKVLLMKDDCILLGYCNNTYMYIGGHVDEGESLIEALKREVLEEVGIEIKVNNINPFLVTEMYSKNHPKIGNNRNCIIYYYALNINDDINLNRTKYTEQEKTGNFEIRQIKLNRLIEEVTNNYLIYDSAKGIGTEMINAFDVYMNN